jgi:hypothetical protein
MITPRGENPDVIIDLRNTEPTYSSEIFSDSDAINAIKDVLIIGVAARHGEVDALRMHWDDRHAVDGEPLQKVALEALRDAAIAGLDRLAGDHVTKTPAHSVYDQLFSHSTDKTHGEFLERLSWMSQVTWKLFKFPEFELTSEQEAQFIANEQRFMKAADQLFHDLFFMLATTSDVPDKYTDMVNDILGPEIAALYLDKKYIIGMLKFVRTPRNVLKSPLDEVQFYEWMLRQEQRLRLKKLGTVATSANR